MITAVARGGMFSNAGVGSMCAVGGGIYTACSVALSADNGSVLSSGTYTMAAGSGIFTKGTTGSMPAFGTGDPAAGITGTGAHGGSMLSGDTCSTARAISCVTAIAGVCGGASCAVISTGGDRVKSCLT